MDTDQKSEPPDAPPENPAPSDKLAAALVILRQRLRVLVEAARSTSEYLHGEAIDRTLREIRDDLDSAFLSAESYLQTIPILIGDNWFRRHAIIVEGSLRRHRENERLRQALLDIEGTARKWAVSQGGNTPLALIATLARNALGMTLEECNAEVARLKADRE